MIHLERARTQQRRTDAHPEDRQSTVPPGAESRMEIRRRAASAAPGRDQGQEYRWVSAVIDDALISPHRVPRRRKAASEETMDFDVIVVGAGLAGLVAAHELTRRAGRSRCSTRRTPPTSAGRRSGRSAGCSWSTRRSSGAWGSRTPSNWLERLAGQRPVRPVDDEDSWRGRWARAYVEFAAGEKRSWLHEPGHPVAADGRLGRARRPAGGRARQLGAALPRHLGHRHRAWWSRSRARPCERPTPGLLDLPPPPPGRRTHRRRRAP